MTALLVARITVKDAEKMQAYSAAAGPIVAAHGGAFVDKGKHAAHILGTDSAHAIALIRFPDVDRAQAWFASPEYSALQPLRDAAAEMQFSVYQTG